MACIRGDVVTGPHDGAVTDLTRIMHAGRPHWRFADGTLLPVLAGAAEGDPPAPPAPPTPPAPTPPTPTPQPEPPAPDLAGLQAALDQARATGQTAALQPLLDAAGVSDADGLQAFITAAREAQLASLDEVQRRELAAQERERQAERLIAEANANARAATVRSALVVAGAPGEHVADLVGLVQVPEGADQAAIDTAVAAVKTKFPALFTATTGAPDGVPGGRPKPADGGKSGYERGRERGKAEREAAASRPPLFAGMTPLGPLGSSN